VCSSDLGLTGGMAGATLGGGLAAKRYLDAKERRNRRVLGLQP
jgi:hypothetical protein